MKVALPVALGPIRLGAHERPARDLVLFWGHNGMIGVNLFPDRAKTVDEFAWLEDIHAEDALAWVISENERTSEMLTTPSFERTSQAILEVLDSTDRIPTVAKHSGFLYNLWRDAAHPRGLWRRTTLASFRTPRPEWDVLLDVDELCRVEGAEWVFSGVRLLHPDYRRALLRLSPDGGDAVAVREFDLDARTFVTDGFILSSAKTDVAWIDHDTLFVATDFGPGSLTTSSYPRIVKRWRRGLPLAAAELVFEVPESHMTAWGHHQHTTGFERDLVTDVVDFYTSRMHLIRDGQTIHVDVPDDADVELHGPWLLVRPRTPWTATNAIHPAGSLLAANLEAYLAGDRDLTVLFTPDEHTSLERWSWTRHHLLLTLLHDVASRIEVRTPGPDGWTSASLGLDLALQTVSASGVDADDNDDFWLEVTGFLQPATLRLGTVGVAAVETLKTSPSFFVESRFDVQQHFATSKDGTRVPYFQIAARDLKLDGNNPALLSGYGGFEISLTPQYNGVAGRAWLDRGGVFIVANIRGGGEYGPTWHQAALRGNRHRAYEDFAAVAQDVIARKITSPEHLGCVGGSNGGLLVGNMLTHYPELFGAIVCEVPLLDMQRYTKLSAGYSWIAEYGDPDDPAEWAFIQTFSPYHNLRNDVTYPPILFYTATSDDRVGPVQARKMAARMHARGIPDVWFYENREGGHGAASDNKQTAHLHASAYEFLWERLSHA